MATYPESQRLKVNPSSQVLTIMISPHVAVIEQHHPSSQAQPIMDGNMINNNPQGITYFYEQTNVNQPRVQINVTSQNVESTQIIPTHANILNHNNVQAHVGTQNRGAPSMQQYFQSFQQAPIQPLGQPQFLN